MDDETREVVQSWEANGLRFELFVDKLHYDAFTADAELTQLVLPDVGLQITKLAP